MTYFPKLQPKPYGSGWFDCGCEPEIIVCRDDGRSQNEINQCEPQPPCESQNFLNDGFGFNGGCGGHGGFGGFGGFGGYNECGWAATKGWTWWEGNNYGNNYCDVPKFVVPDCNDDYVPSQTQEAINDVNYDPCGCNVDIT